ncbi:hypothetical protein N7520_002269 [Penicillium odoratum]|uniref:uncharacterized protein n=1 Tax=Penicillium odoratum TaxID=1167516 RepID=UPI002547D956|nr:uncharacterized protein N7520_002269 [Penicillium odoratum]KAJ5771740.1 hypothetical protein N7520_002269 [Penicillium odoratum]
MSLFDLPNELLYQIISNVESEIDLSSLLQGYSDLEAMILPRLHQLIAEKYEHLHLEHCAAHRMAECMRYSLKINEGFGSTHPYSVGNALCCAAMIGRNDMVQIHQ